MRRPRPCGFAVCLAIAALLFARPLVDWAAYAWRADEASYVLLIPFIVVYLFREQWKLGAIPRPRHLNGAPRPAWPGSEVRASSSDFPLSPLPSAFWLLPIAGGALALALWWWIPVVRGSNWHIVWPTLVFVGSVLGTAGWWFGWSMMWQLRFPAAYLVLMVPVPTVLMNHVEVLLQFASAEAAHVLFAIAGVPVLRDGLVFRLPTITLEVAQECSGVRSTLVLFVTSLLAGHLFLRRPWKKWVLALAVLPLGILRNGFRIVTIGWLCVHVSPDMVHSPIHHRGGPIFFVLSLIPLFLLLWWLRWSERPGEK